MAILASDVIRNAEKLGFSTDIADRQRQVAHDWSDVPSFMPTMQGLVPGNLRQIIPVHICTQGFVGFQVDGESDSYFNVFTEPTNFRNKPNSFMLKRLLMGSGSSGVLITPTSRAPSEPLHS